MNIPKDFLIRKHLDFASEILLVEKLKKNYDLYFPYHDTGIDAVALKKNNSKHQEFYQLKARNPPRYWFDVKRNIYKLVKRPEKPIFFIFCVFQPKQKKFDFFKVPLNVVSRYLKEKKTKNRFFQMAQLQDGTYELRPKRIKIDINKYRL